MINHALRYASLGWAVFPVKTKDKTPLTGAGFRDATTDERQIVDWWTRWRTANVGVACGASDIVVVDVDLPHGPESIRTLDVHLPATLTQRTGSGGTQFIYKAPPWKLRNTTGRLPGVGKLLGVDLRADGGYIIVPESVHPNGKTYEWVHRVWPEPCPEWLKEPPAPKPEPLPTNISSKYAEAALEGEVRKVQYALKGSRNNTLNEAAFALGQLTGLLDESTIITQLKSAAVQSGLPEGEALQTIRSGMAAGARHPRGERVS